MSESNAERVMLMQLHAVNLPKPVKEHRFAAPDRQWRFDFCWPEHRIALEVEGGVWSRGRHTRGGGYTSDCEKYNEATLMGWTVLRATVDMVQDGRALDAIERAFEVFAVVEHGVLVGLVRVKEGER